MSPTREGGPVLLIGGSGGLQEAMETALVADEWSVVRPTNPGASVIGLPSDAELEPFWTAPTPPRAVIVAFELEASVPEIAATLERWIGRLSPGGSAVLVREFGAEWTFPERLARGTLTALTAELARRVAPHRRVNAVYGSPPPTEDEALPLRRKGTVTDLAATATFLAGPASAFLTGVMILVDGGAHLRWPLSDA